jgi:hypothetical protein
VSNDPLINLFHTLDAIAAIPRISKADIEHLFGAALAHAADASPEEQYYSADLPSSPFSNVEVRVSNPTQNEFELVILEVRPNARLSVDALRAAGRIRTDTPAHVNPDVPPEGTASYIVRGPTQAVHYEFNANNDQLQSVMIERPPGP